MIAEKDCSIGELSYESFENCLGGKLKDVLMKSEQFEEVIFFFHF